MFASNNDKQPVLFKEKLADKLSYPSILIVSITIQFVCKSVAVTI